jgi:hypothetical protein
VRGIAETARVATAARSAQARRRVADVMPTIEAVRQSGVAPLAGIAVALNKQEIPTPSGVVGGTR